MDAMDAMAFPMQKKLEIANVSLSPQLRYP
jgi:hypothetical protein